jgi:phosphate transport system protein
MSEKKEQALNEIQATFSEMANLVLHQLTLLEKLMATKEDDVFDSLASEMEKTESRIDNLEVVIGEQFTSTIVLYQPVASDVRRLVAIYRMSINLERIGDRIHNLVWIIHDIRKSPEYVSVSSLINNMLTSGTIMVEKSLLSFSNSDPDYAIWTIKNDSVVDEMNHKLLLGHLRKENIDERTMSMVQSYIELKEIITNIERIADHATNIAEASIYSCREPISGITGIGKDDSEIRQ